MRGYIYILISFVALLLTACDKHVPEEQGIPLSFSAAAENAPEVKTGTEKTTNANLTDSSFGVFGIYTPGEGDETGTNVFLSSSAMEVSHNGADWTYSPLAYWSINQFYRFRAYHPYSGSAFTVNSSSTADNLVIEYKIASGEEDLLVGFKTLEATVDNIQKKVPITFKHALSGLQFKIAFKNSPEIADDYTDDVKSFYLHGIIPTGTLIYGHTGDDFMTEELRWIATYYDESEYYVWEGTRTFGKYNGNNAVNIFDGTDGIVFAIPQTCSSTPEKPTSIHFKTTKGGDALHSATLPQTVWEPGKIYTYTFLIEKSDIQVLISIKDWTEVQSNENIYI